MSTEGMRPCFIARPPIRLSGRIRCASSYSGGRNSNIVQTSGGRHHWTLAVSDGYYTMNVGRPAAPPNLGPCHVATVLGQRFAMFRSTVKSPKLTRRDHAQAWTKKKLDMEDGMTMVFRVQDAAMLKADEGRRQSKFDADRVNGQITAGGCGIMFKN
jgi:hypothetical protein